ncbi:MAG: GC-type dockerin domain-anchored protein [Phycisphaerales bacterium]
MKFRAWPLAATGTILLLSSYTSAGVLTDTAPGNHACGLCPSGVDQALDLETVQETALELTPQMPGEEESVQKMAQVIFPMLPEEEQSKIVQATHELGLTALDSPCSGFTPKLENIPDRNTADSATAWIESALVVTGTDGLTTEQLTALRSIANAIDSGAQMAPLCFAPNTNPEYVWLVNQLMNPILPNAFQQIDRWQRTALSGNGLEQGDPTIITYSYIADGTFIPDAGFGSGNSLLFAWLNTIYGSPGVWQPLFDQVFDRWAELTGTSYVYEPNDDGSLFFTTPGLAGVRGDVRIGAMPLDGNFNVLAFNFFPESGDMVFDAFDSFYQGTGGNSLGLRNVIAHEHGHGLGMLHVCPVTESFLMEPFVSFAFDGPQVDDILNGQRHYGDPFEPNDTAINAVDLGSLNLMESLDFDTVSLDDPTDRDFYKLTLISPALVGFTASPDAATYEQGPQTETCEEDEYGDTNYNNQLDLQINVYSADDLVNPIFTSISGFPGQPEELVFAAPQAGDYFFEVFTTFVLDSIQRYRIDVTTGTLLAISAETPVFLEPGVTNEFNVALNPFEEAVEPGTEFLRYRVGTSGAFSSIPLMPTKGINYLAMLPAFECDPDTEIQYYIEASVIGSNTSFTLPQGGPQDPFVAFIGQTSAFFSDSFQGNLGWGVSGDVMGQNAGQWERGVPAGDGSRGDPPVDGDGSGSCYLTGNGGPGSNTDVDGMMTILTSPQFDIAGVDRPSVSYWRWFDNTGSGVGSGGGEDTFLVEVSDDGGVSWELLEEVGPNSPESVGGWFFVEFDLIQTLAQNEVQDFDFSTSQLQLRFIAQDLMNSSVIEAGIDGVSVSELVCNDPEPIITLAAEPAASVAAGEDFVFEVFIDEPIDTVVPGSAKVFYLVANGGLLGGGGFIEAPLVFNGGNSYTATIPAQECSPNSDMLPPGSFDVTYYIEVEGELTGFLQFPDLDTEALLGYNIGDAVLVFEDSFELDEGWTVSGGAKSAIDGMWERGVPMGDGSAGDPTVDADGSGSCYLTGNLPGSANSDVDTLTILTSPVFDASGLNAARFEYSRWYNNTGVPGTPNSDVMEVGISYDGGESYETIDIIGPNSADSMGGWIQDELILDTFGPVTSQMRVRFVLSDQGTGSIIEAGIDAVTIAGLLCEFVVACPPDLAGNPDGTPDGILNFFDVSAFLTLFAQGDPMVDYAGNPDGTPDGVLNFFDVSAFLNAYGNGCP